jgi:hypothetical protein
MSTDGHIPLPRFQIFERTFTSLPALENLDNEIRKTLSALGLPPDKLAGHRIAVSVGSRGIANVTEIARAVCRWLKDQGAHPFIFPGMGSHGGATAEGQRKILEGYGVTEDYVGAEIRASMESVSLGLTSEGFQVFMDRNAWEADAVLVMNRIKPHTDFTGKNESGLLKMMSVGMGKVEGARETHRWGWKHGYDKTIRAMSGKVLASGKILCGLAVVENELHQICTARAARPEGIVDMEETVLELARRLLPRIPLSKFHLLIVDELGKNISGTGMDTRVIGRGLELQPGEAPEIKMIYVRDLTAESAGNSVGVGFADMIHERLYRKIDLQKMYVNTRTSMNPPAARLPIYLSSDREALDLALGAIGSPEADDQRVVWIRNTLRLDRIAVSTRLASEMAELSGWRLDPKVYTPQFDAAGDLGSPV